MFKNRAFQVKVVNTDPDQTGRKEAAASWTPDQIQQFGKEAIKTLALTCAALYAVKVVLDTTQEITIKKTKSK